MSFSVRVPLLDTVEPEEILDDRLNPFLYTGDGNTDNAIRQFQNPGQALFPSKSYQFINESKYGRNHVETPLHKRSTNTLGKTLSISHRYATFRLPKLPSSTKASDSSTFIFTKNLQPFLKSERITYSDSDLSLPEFSEELSSPSKSFSKKTVRIIIPETSKLLSISDNLKERPNQHKNRRHSDGHEKRPTGSFKNTKFTVRESSNAKLGALNVKDSLTLIKASVRRNKRSDVKRQRGRNEENGTSSFNDFESKSGSSTRSRPARKKGVHSVKDAQKTSKMIKARLESLEKTLHEAQSRIRPTSKT